MRNLVSKNIIAISEAVFFALFLTAFSYLMRSVIVNMEEYGTSAFTWRAIGLLGSLSLVGFCWIVPDRGRLSGALCLTGVGLVYGLGLNGVNWPRTYGTYWDIKLLWFYFNGDLTFTHPNYLFFKAAAFVSASGIVLAAVGAVASLSVIENLIKELGTNASHKGTNKYRSRDTVLGDAKWGSWRKMASAVGAENGVVLGEDYDPRQNQKAFEMGRRATWGQGGKSELITLSPKYDSGHVLVFAGPGSGKTAGIVYPTCFTYTGSIIVVDSELEILDATRQAREDMGRQVRIIKPGQGINLLRFLDRVSEDRDQVYAHLAAIITEPATSATSEAGNFFREEAQNIIAGLLNYFHTKGEPNPFLSTLLIISKEENAFKKDVADIVARQAEGSLLHLMLSSYVSMESRTFTSFQTTVKQALKWAPYQQLLEMVTTEPDAAPDIFNANTDVYIQIKKADLKTYPGLVRLMLGTIAYAVDAAPDGIERVMIVDEAYQIGRISTFEIVRDTARKRHLHLMQIFQSMGQLRALYGEAGVSAWENAVAARVFAAIENDEDQAKLSKLLGEYTADVTGSSRSSSTRGFGIGTPTSGSSHNTSLRNVRLMLPDQIRTLPADASIILFKSQNPLICGKAFSFRRREWQKYTPFRKR